MSESLLTPVTLWQDFKIDEAPKEEILSETTIGGTVLRKSHIGGRTTAKGQVKIFALTAIPKKAEKLPALLIVSNYSTSVDEGMVLDYAKRGYRATMIDLCGDPGAGADGERGTENASDVQTALAGYTLYPEDVSYANYEKVRNDILNIENTVKETCWYEWACAVKYAVNFLKNLPEVTCVGAMGVCRGSTPLWQACVSEPDLKCAVFTFCTGWSAYENYFKFAGKEPQFSDKDFKVLAGIEPQSYAKYVRCPSYTVVPTNSRVFDCDRAYDTVSRIEDDVYSAIDYVVGSRDLIDYQSYKNLNAFIDNYLSDNKTYLPQPADISADYSGEEFTVKVKCDVKNLENVTVFAGEDTFDPALRDWNQRAKKTDAENFVFSYKPSPTAENVVFFAKLTYSDAPGISTKIVNRKILKKSERSVSVNRMYSSNTDGLTHSFYPANLKSENYNNFFIKSDVKPISYKKGPSDIYGLYAPGGLMTYKVNTLADKPKDNAVLMLDVYSKEQNVLTVELVFEADSLSPVSYFASVSFSGGELWRNFKFDITRFKTADGKSPKGFEKLNAAVFNCEKPYLLNNVLWI